MEDEPLFAVEDPQPQEVAIEEVAERPQVERRPVVEPLEPEHPLVRRAQEPRLGLERRAPAPALELLAGEGLGVAQVLAEVEEDRVLLAVPLLERGAELRHRPGDVDPRVLLERVELALRAPEELQEVLAAVPSPADPLAAEDLLAPDVEAVRADRLGAVLEQAGELGREPGSPPGRPPGSAPSRSGSAGGRGPTGRSRG